MRYLVIILAISLCLPLAAVAQYAGVIGLYFDEEGQMDCLDSYTLAPYTQFSMYVVLTEANFDMLYGFEMGYTRIGDSFLSLSTSYYWPHIPIIPDPDNFICGFGAPLPVVGPTPLIHQTLLNISIEPASICLQVHGSSPSSSPDGLPIALLAGDEIVPLMPNNGVGVPCNAWIEPGGCQVATQPSSWDTVKSLYR